MKINSISENYSAIIFDFDGTLFTVDLNWKEFKAELVNSYPTVFSSIDETKLSSVINNREKHKNFEQWKIYLQHLEKYEKLATITPVQKGISIYLTLQKTKKISIVSNNLTTTILTTLQKYRLPFDKNLIIGLDKSNYPKPYPIGVQMAIEKMKYIPNEVILVGNSLKDKEAANAIGIKFIHVNNIEF
jgi:HAD superfamily hydrolase (TIGR01549 family)